MVLPRSSTIAESKLVNRNQIKFLWYIDPTFIFIKKDFILKICNPKKKKEFLFDGSNFRGFMSGCELITKGYLNDFATAIVGDIQINEDHDITLSKNYLVNNETIDDAIQNYFQEGKKWLKGKYGFNTKWQMIMYSKYFYDIFFKFNKELIKFKI